MWSTRELIVAPATACGSGCRSVVRISGEALGPLLEALVQPIGTGFAAVGAPPRLAAAWLAAPALVADWGRLPVDVVHWPGPQGPTGGPLAELHLPASRPLVDAVVEEACRNGARLARGGEFTLRSFLAGRLDLVQAEAVLAVVEATSSAELSAALDVLAGGVGRRLQPLRESLLDCAADVEASIDFSDETTPDAVPAAEAAARAEVDRRLAAAAAEIEGIRSRLAGRDTSAAGELPRVVLAGPPNIGKSSLFNRLVGRDAALVADESGTTRDWVAARLDADPAEPPCLLVDVAGVAADACTDGDLLARLVDARAREAIAAAAVVVACRDAAPSSGTDEATMPLPAATATIDVLTRCDLGAIDADSAGTIPTSSRSGRGVADLRAAILRAVAALPGGRVPATVHSRAALSTAVTAVDSARRALGTAAGDEAIVAALLRRAVAAIDEVTGAEIGPDLIDRIFARHCIGK